VNEYLPGQGIAPHVDTHDAFGPTLLSLSLVSGIVMDFRHCPGPVIRTELSAIRRTDLLQTPKLDNAARNPTNCDEKADTTLSNDTVPYLEHIPHQSDASAKKSRKSADSITKGDDESSEEAARRLLLWLPPRSLLALSDDSRYCPLRMYIFLSFISNLSCMLGRYAWSHGIAPRKVDRVNGELIPRTGRRVSLTFRKVLRPGEACHCGCGAVSAHAQMPTKLKL